MRSRSPPIPLLYPSTDTVHTHHFIFFSSTSLNPTTVEEGQRRYLRGNHRDNSGGLTALHMAASYVKPGVAKLLIEFGADAEIEDERGRTPLQLATEILKVTPQLQFARRLGLESVVGVLEGSIYEFAEVDEIMERRGKGENVEYLVKWKDGGENKWVKARFMVHSLDVLRCYLNCQQRRSGLAAMKTVMDGFD